MPADASFHFLLDPRLSPPSAAFAVENGAETPAARPEAPGSAPTLSVPDGVSYLARHSVSELRLLAEPPAGGGWALEPLLEDGDPLLLLLRDAGDAGVGELRVNGTPAPPVALASPGDQLQWEGGATLHLVLHRVPRVETVGKDEEARSHCPLCRTRLQPGDRVWVCATCRGAYHFPEAPVKEGALECVRTLSSCAVCRQEVSLAETFGPLPEI